MNKNETKHYYVAQDKKTGDYIDFIFEDEVYRVWPTKNIFHAGKYEAMEDFFRIQDEYGIDLSNFIFIGVKFTAEYTEFKI